MILTIKEQAEMGLVVALPPVSQQMLQDTDAVQLAASNSADNEIVVQIAAARSIAKRAIELSTAGVRVRPAGAKASSRASSRPVSANHTQRSAFQSVLAGSPYAVPQRTKNNTQPSAAAGWRTSALSRPLTSPLRPRTATTRRAPALTGWSGRVSEDEGMNSV